MFFPINRDRRPDRTPYATLALIIINSLLWSGLTIAGINGKVVWEYGLRPAHWTAETLFASMFLHAGLFHVAGNMWFLWMFAPKIEERLGSVLFLVAYLICGIGGAGLHSLLSWGATIPVVGASGAISGIVGIYFLLFPRSPFSLVLYLGFWFSKSFNVMTRGAIGGWIGEQFVLGLITGFGAGGGIAFWAHVGGFLTGMSIAGVVLMRSQPEERRVILRPPKLTDEERDEIFADREEKPSTLTTLRLND